MKKCIAFLLCLTVAFSATLFARAESGKLLTDASGSINIIRKEGNCYALNIPEGCTAGRLKSLFSDSENIRVLTSDGSPAEDTRLIISGDRLCLYSGEEIAEQATAAIKCDVNLDSRARANDARLALRAAAELEKLPELQYLIADFNRNGTVAANDARNILRYTAGLETRTDAEEASIEASRIEAESKRAEESRLAEESRIAEQSRLAEESRKAEESSIEASVLEQERRRLTVIPEAPSPVSPNYYDDAVFVGDSVSMSLRNYCRSNGGLGNAQFLVGGSLSAMNALWNVSSSSCHPYYNGTKVKVESGVRYTGAKKVFIMLGMNEIAMGLEKALGNYTKLIELILASSPDTQIIIESVTPLAYGSTSTSNSLNNTRINQYNEMLIELCRERGWRFLNVAEVLKDENGYLQRSYCSDYPTMGLHLTYTADRVWINYLLTHPC